MRPVIQACVVGLILLRGAGGQDSTKPQLKPGIAVEMPVALHAVEMRAADEEKATVVVITADERVYLGTQPTDSTALRRLQGTVYVKADSRVPFQKVLSVLDALRSDSVVLLTAPLRKAPGQEIAWPYGVKLMLSR